MLNVLKFLIGWYFSNYFFKSNSSLRSTHRNNALWMHFFSWHLSCDCYLWKSVELNIKSLLFTFIPSVLWIYQTDFSWNSVSFKFDISLFLKWFDVFAWMRRYSIFSCCFFYSFFQILFIIFFIHIFGFFLFLPSIAYFLHGILSYLYIDDF